MNLAPAVVAGTLAGIAGGAASVSIKGAEIGNTGVTTREAAAFAPLGAGLATACVAIGTGNANLAPLAAGLVMGTLVGMVGKAAIWDAIAGTS